MAHKKSFLSLSKSKPSAQNSINQFPCSSSASNETFSPTSPYAKLLDQVRGHSVTIFPKSELKLPPENEHFAGGDSEDESGVSREQSPPKWTPLPPPNINYILWNTMSMLSNEDIKKDKDTHQQNVNLAQELQVKRDSDKIEPMYYGKVGKVPAPVEEDDDFADISIEDEQAFAALMEEDFGNELMDEMKEEQVGQRDAEGKIGIVEEPESRTGHDNSDMESDDDFNIPVADEQVFDALIQEGFDTILSQSTHQSQNLASLPSPGSVNSFKKASCILDAKSKSPADIYEIDDDFDDIISTEDLNCIDKDIEVYIKNSPKSSSSDELPPVQWDARSTKKTKREIWLPVSDSVLQGQPSGSVAGSDSCRLVVERCLRCYFKFPPSFTQEEADEHVALCLSLEDFAN